MDENYQIALKRIEEAKQKNLKKLVLFKLQLTELPKEIFELSNLTELDLSHNELSSLPESISKLSNLSILELYYNQLSSLPESISKLSDLTELSLGGNELTSLPNSISRLRNLTSLGLYGNKLNSLPKRFSKLSNLTYLNLNNNFLRRLPESITKLINLTKLSLKVNGLRSLPESISKLSNLTELDLSHNELSSLPEGISNLSNLTELNLWGNELSSIPESIFKLSNLTWLFLCQNELSSLSESISKLSNLTELDLSDNELSSLPESISKLSNLNGLSLRGIKLSSLPESISKLGKLRALDLRHTGLSYLPESISKLSNLINLYLSDNELSSLPESISKLSNLINLKLDNNLFEVGTEIFELPAKEQIKEILKWQRAQKEGTLQPIHEAKVIFIGESNYGKTHLIELLRVGEIKKKIKTTHGIERSQLRIPYKAKDICLNIWDLGGQEFMRSTHQFFFSERTLYVLVTLARRERNELNHWLKLANQLGNKAPVLVVINKIDLDSHDIDRKSLERDYPNIVGFVRTCIYDCMDTKAIDSINLLNEKITTIVSDKDIMPGVFEKRPPDWFMVKEELEKLEAKGRDFITYQEYEDLEFVKDLPKEDRKSNLKLLSMLGAVVSYVDDPRLIDTNVINPQWIMDGVYTIINDPKIKDENKGCLSIKELERILSSDQFPKARHFYLLNLMQKFNLCYEAKDKRDIYFIPDLFTDIEPDFEWDSNSSMHFRYNYDDFPPDAFITRFIVEMHEDIQDDKRWRSGVLISNASCQAKVYQTYRKNYIHIEVSGARSECRSYLYAIRETFRKLHKPFPEMKIIQEVNYKDIWLDYMSLVKLEDKNKPRYHVGLDEDLPITEILNGYSTPKERKNDSMQKVERLLGKLKQDVEEVKKTVTSTNQLLKFGFTQSTVIEYPNVFTLMPAGGLMRNESNFYSEYELQLYCSHHECLHPVGEAYKLKIPKDWLKKIAPYCNKIVKALKLVAPAINVGMFTALGPASFVANKFTLKFAQAYIKKIPEIGDAPDLRAYEPRSATESEMQTIQKIMNKADSEKSWMLFLQKVIYQDKVFWMCPEHAEEFKIN